MPKFKVKIYETRTISGEYIIEAVDAGEALNKAMTGDTESETYNEYSMEIVSRDTLDFPEQIEDAQPE